MTLLLAFYLEGETQVGGAGNEVSGEAFSASFDSETIYSN